MNKYLFAIIITCTALFFITCNTAPVKKPTFPRIVQNNCGTYAVQIGFHVVNKNDTVWEYIGRPPGQNIFWLSGEALSFVDSFVQLKQVRHDLIWKNGDTIYNSVFGYEFTFKDTLSAKGSLNGYVSRSDLEKKFLDSINKCHVYHSLSR